ncbi:hypothetical protein BDY21DRAFT_356884 [Lineolata rhizophorae]|uniref:Nucleolar 27S pre-rRNA processing Urb2/Npa2 C-terminal domain-containing protein n=1 Tax=Lineolata rhizophorae TaxID=578093 RepID=A0A6A6NNI3_9PEZI|nr:hypothetical protein BDY21DRAFT_356884 [Lineolata rhizophorae]
MADVWTSVISPQPPKPPPPSAMEELKAMSNLPELDDMLTDAIRILGVPSTWLERDYFLEPELFADVKLQFNTEYILRFLISKMFHEKDGKAARHNVTAWKLIKWCIISTPLINAAKTLRIKNFMSVVETTLMEICSARLQISHPVVNGNNEESRKRKYSPDGPTQDFRLPAESAMVFLALSMTLETALAGATTDSANVSSTFAMQTMRSGLRTSGQRAARILGYALDIIESILLFQWDFFDQCGMRVLEPSLAIWEMRHAEADNTTSQLSFAQFARHCLAPATKIMAILYRDVGVPQPSWCISNIPERAIVEKLEELIGRHFFLPLRIKFFDETARDAVLVSLKSALIDLKERIYSGSVSCLALACLFSLAIRATSRPTKVEEIREAPWVEMVFTALAEIAGYPPEAQYIEDSEPDIMSLQIMLETLRMRNVRLGTPSYRRVLLQSLNQSHYTGIVGEILTQDPDVVVDPELAQRILKRLAEPLDSGHLSCSPKRLRQSKRSSYSNILDDVAIPLLKACGRNRKIKQFVEEWSALITTSPPLRDHELIRNFGDVLPVSCSTKLVEEMFEEYSRDLGRYSAILKETVDEVTGKPPSAPKHLPGHIFILQALVSAFLPPQTTVKVAMVDKIKERLFDVYQNSLQALGTPDVSVQDWDEQRDTSLSLTGLLARLARSIVPVLPPAAESLHSPTNIFQAFINSRALSFVLEEAKKTESDTANFAALDLSFAVCMLAWNFGGDDTRSEAESVFGKVVGKCKFSGAVVNMICRYPELVLTSPTEIQRALGRRLQNGLSGLAMSEFTPPTPSISPFQLFAPSSTPENIDVSPEFLLAVPLQAVAPQHQTAILDSYATYLTKCSSDDEKLGIKISVMIRFLSNPKRNASITTDPSWIFNIAHHFGAMVSPTDDDKLRIDKLTCTIFDNGIIENRGQLDGDEKQTLIATEFIGRAREMAKEYLNKHQWSLRPNVILTKFYMRVFRALFSEGYEGEMWVPWAQMLSYFIQMESQAEEIPKFRKWLVAVLGALADIPPHVSLPGLDNMVKTLTKQVQLNSLDAGDELAAKDAAIAIYKLHARAVMPETAKAFVKLSSSFLASGNFGLDQISMGPIFQETIERLPFRSQVEVLHLLAEEVEAEDMSLCNLVLKVVLPKLEGIHKMDKEETDETVRAEKLSARDAICVAFRQKTELLGRNGDIRVFNYGLDFIDTLIQTAKSAQIDFLVSQTGIDELAASLTCLTRAQAPNDAAALRWVAMQHADSPATYNKDIAGEIYFRVCTTASNIIRRYRKRGRGRLQTLEPLLKNLIKLLFTPGNPSRADTALAREYPRWLGDPKCSPLGVEHAAACSSLLSTMWSPQPSASGGHPRPHQGNTDNDYDAESAPGNLTDPTVLERKRAIEPAIGVLTQVAQCQQRGGVLVGTIRSVLLPTLKEAAELLGDIEVTMLGVKLDSGVRELVRGLLDETGTRHRKKD